MEKQKNIDPFSNIPESIPLEESMKEVDLDGQEASAEDIQLAEIGFNLKKVEAYKKRFQKDTVLYQGFPVKAFFEWYLKACDTNELNLLKEHKNKLKENQAKQLETTETIDITKEPSEVQGYIQKNADLLANNAEMVKRNDELFKKISELQDERDRLQNAINILINGEQKLCKHLIQIFKDQKVKAELTEEEIQLVKELSAK